MSSDTHTPREPAVPATSTHHDHDLVGTTVRFWDRLTDTERVGEVLDRLYDATVCEEHRLFRIEADATTYRVPVGDVGQVVQR